MASTTTMKECACFAGTCVLCAIAAPFLVIAGIVVYAFMLLGMTAGTAWGVASAVTGEVDDAKVPRLDA